MCLRVSPIKGLNQGRLEQCLHEVGVPCVFANRQRSSMALFPSVRVQHFHLMNVDVSLLSLQLPLPLPQGIVLIMDDH